MITIHGGGWRLRFADRMGLSQWEALGYCLQAIATVEKMFPGEGYIFETVARTPMGTYRLKRYVAPWGNPGWLGHVHVDTYEGVLFRFGTDWCHAGSARDHDPMELARNFGEPLKVYITGDDVALSEAEEWLVIESEL